MTAEPQALEILLIVLCLVLLLVAGFLGYRLRQISARAEGWRAEHTQAIGALSALEERLEARKQASEEMRLMLGKQLSDRENRLAQAEGQVTRLGHDLAALEERLTQERRVADEKLALLQEGREQMNLQFKSLARDVLRTESDEFKKAATTQVQGLIAPLAQNLGKFESEFRNTQRESVKERAALTEKLGTLTNESARLSKEADTLSRALRGDSKQQGAWGEAILERLLESSGLEEGREYRSQATVKSEQGGIVRPDILISLPGGRELVIDSKVSLTAYDEAINAENDAERRDALSRHVLSLTSHIKGLGAKDYAELTQGSLDYVILFVPIEGALAEAVREKPDLTALAADLRVMIATPTTLMMALRTIKNVWDVERRNTNAEEIAGRAGKLYDKFVGFIEDMQKVSDQLDKARASHGAALNKLSIGSGNLVRQAEMLKDLRAKTTKALPEAVVEKSKSAEMLPVSQKNMSLRARKDEAS